MDIIKPNLDEDARHFLSILNERANKELGKKKLSDLPVTEARKVIGKLLAPDPDLKRIPLPKLDVAVGDSSLSYVRNSETVKLPIKIYAPRAHDVDLPVLVYFHGGGFALGDAGLIDYGCQYIAEHVPCRVVSVDYRKSPEFKFPSAHYDAYFATLYIADHPEEFKSNGVIAVGGDSAGGNLATSVAHMAKASGLFNIAFQLLYYPWVDLNNNSPSDRELAKGYYLELDTLQWMTNLYITTDDDKNNPLASPKLRTQFSGLPPAFVVIGDADPIHDDAKEYAEKLRKGSVEVVYKEFPGVLHDYCAMPTFFRAAQDTFALSVELLKKYMK